ncbi:MAG: hypothetical protein C0507_09695 [Cyanobacteria bacterium PR.3.49]|nr:hypothetical protein [Cyanobacteria bacterium PR.3.49]
MLFKTTGALERMHIFGAWRPVFIVNDSRRMTSVWGTETSFLLPHAESEAVFMGVYFSGDCADESLGRLRLSEVYGKALNVTGDSKELRKLMLIAGRQMIGHSEIRFNSFSTIDFNGKRAAVVEQEWLATRQTSYQIMVDTAGDGRIIYDLIFVAPNHLYSKFVEHAKASFETSLWRNQFDPREPLRLLADEMQAD